MAAGGRPFYPGWIIFLVLFVFFPVGIVLIFIRIHKHRDYTHLKLLDYKICANTLITLFLLSTVSYIYSMGSGESPIFSVYLIATSLSLLPGILLYARANGIKKAMRLRFEHYRSMIYEQGLTSIVQIASNAGMKPVIAGNELERMAYLRLLPNVHIDRASDTVLPISERTENAAEPSPPRTVNCPSCGARTVVRPGESKECSYCHTLVNAG
ncbi:hypothetical protein [Cohnella hongkongensis]|uniref:Zinc ribbon domain-containing protein n=1 Tax=Cohnella hongkongensis TaxID=178337 RepID=A0ABV9F5B9_9BACL